jgi:hypothetical protein
MEFQSFREVSEFSRGFQLGITKVSKDFREVFRQGLRIGLAVIVARAWA